MCSDLRISFEELSIALASTIGKLDSMLKLEDIELKTMLDSLKVPVLSQPFEPGITIFRYYYLN
jgi:hypothetical protein